MGQKKKKAPLASLRKPGGRCIFCPSRATDQEHAFPKWTIRAIAGTRSHKFVTLAPSGESFSSTMPLKPQIVCRSCNTQWMSRLENEARRPILKMMHGVAVELRPGEQLAVALWSLKTAMVFDSAWESGPHYFTQGEREQLARSMTGSLETPFPSWLHVWLGRYDGTEGTSFYGYTVQGFAQPTYRGQQGPVLEIAGYVATISARQFVFQLLIVRIPAEHERAAWSELGLHPKPGLDFSRFIRQIMPTHWTHVSWPPFEILRDTGMSLERFAERWPHGPFLRS